MFKITFKVNGHTISAGHTIEVKEPIEVYLTLETNGIDADFAFEAQCWCEEDLEESVFDADDFLIERI